jgi:hypothetical protein
MVYLSEPMASSDWLQNVLYTLLAIDKNLETIHVDFAV